MRLGRDLETHPLTRDALARGDIVAEQARVIVPAIDQLPDGCETARAEAHLLGEAQHLDAKALRVLGRHLFEVIAPDEADAREAAALEAEEAVAMKACRLTLVDDGEGRTHGRFTIPTSLAGAPLRKALFAIADAEHQRLSPEAMGQTFCEYIGRFPAKRLPKTGGLSATMLVIIDEDSLMGRVERAGVLDTGEKISPSAARRLACAAEVVPVVLGGKSEVLDVGRGRRFHTRAQRYALVVRDRGCRAEGCDRTHGLHAHHKTRWADGGGTNVTEAVTLCHWHHAKAHDPAYETTYLPNGDVTFHRRQ